MMKLLRPILLFIIIIALLYCATEVFAKQATCPNGGGWTKIDSNDLSAYPVEGATQYCFKAGSDNSRGCEGGLFETWPQPEGTCGLSHWSYYIGTQSTPSPEPTATPDPTSTPEPTSTPQATVTPAPGAPPSWADPCFYLQGHPECVTHQEVFGEGDVFGPQK